MDILLVEDHDLFREGIKLLLADLGEPISFSEASTCAEALQLAQTQKFRIVLLDFHLPDTEGLEAVRKLRESLEEAVIVVISGEEDRGLILSTIEAGAAGFIPKRSTRPILMAALRLVLAGGVYLPPLVYMNATSGGGAMPADRDRLLSTLTERQVDTLCLAILGKPNKVIARELGISEATVKAHLSASYRALKVGNRTEAVVAAAKLGISAARPR